MKKCIKPWGVTPISQIPYLWFSSNNFVICSWLCTLELIFSIMFYLLIWKWLWHVKFKMVLVSFMCIFSFLFIDIESIKKEWICFHASLHGVLSWLIMSFTPHYNQNMLFLSYAKKIKMWFFFSFHVCCCYFYMTDDNEYGLGYAIVV